jgi:hypothetical protein
MYGWFFFTFCFFVKFESVPILKFSAMKPQIPKIGTCFHNDLQNTRQKTKDRAT